MLAAVNLYFIFYYLVSQDTMRVVLCAISCCVIVRPFRCKRTCLRVAPPAKVLYGGQALWRRQEAKQSPLTIL
jgi:hypothetical protein